MKITYSFAFLGNSDSLKSVEFCCDEMRDEVVCHNEIKISTSGRVRVGDDREIKFCPHCGSAIIYHGMQTGAYRELERKGNG